VTLAGDTVDKERDVVRNEALGACFSEVAEWTWLSLLANFLPSNLPSLHFQRCSNTKYLPAGSRQRRNTMFEKLASCYDE
jgi:hypothetical protein